MATRAEGVVEVGCGAVLGSAASSPGRSGATSGGSVATRQIALFASRQTTASRHEHPGRHTPRDRTRTSGVSHTPRSHTNIRGVTHPATCWLLGTLTRLADRAILGGSDEAASGVVVEGDVLAGGAEGRYTSLRNGRTCSSGLPSATK